MPPFKGELLRYRTACQRIVDSFIESVERFEIHSWEVVLSYFPVRLRILIEKALDQSKNSPKRGWPDLILSFIGRNDLCSNAIIVVKFFLSHSSPATL